jgi:predicted aconitase with swiveling domain
MVCTADGVIHDRHHELFKQSIRNAILIFPNAIGSSVGAYSIYSLMLNGAAPKSMICSKKTDITTASGCAISNIPLAELFDANMLSLIRVGSVIKLNADEGSIIIQTI